MAKQQASKGGKQPATQGGRQGGEASSADKKSSQGLKGAQGSGGGAERGMTDAPPRKRAKSA